MESTGTTVHPQGKAMISKEDKKVLKRLSKENDWAFMALLTLTLSDERRMQFYKAADALIDFADTKP